MTGETAETSKILKEMSKEFGVSVDVPEWETKTPKTYTQGARCDLNPKCRKVNTKRCNIGTCQKRITFVSETYDYTKPKNPQ